MQNVQYAFTTVTLYEVVLIHVLCLCIFQNGMSAWMSGNHLPNYEVMLEMGSG